MGAKFSRVKTWVKEKLYYQDLNAEFDNILIHLDPLGVDGASSTLLNMQANIDPAPYQGSPLAQNPSLATDLLGEIKRLRFMFLKLVGGANWYTDPGRILSANSSDMLSYLPFDGISAVDAYTDSITRRIQIGALDINNPSFASSMMNSSNKKFGNFGYSLNSANILAQASTSNALGALSLHFRNLSAGDYLAWNPVLGIALYLDGSGFLTYTQILSTEASEGVKAVKTVAGSVSRAGVTTFQHVLLRWVLNGANGSGADSLNLLLGTSAIADSAEGSQLNAQTTVVNGNSDNFWFFGAKPNAFTYDKLSTFGALPDAEITHPWVGVGDNSLNAVSGGVLTLTSNASATNLYKADAAVAVNALLMTLEAKVKLTTYANQGDLVVVFRVDDNSNSRRVILKMLPGYVELTSGATSLGKVYIDTENFNIFRLTATSDRFRLYINGILVLDVTSIQVTAAGSSFLEFGITPAGGSDCVAAFEYIGSYATGGIVAPVTGSSTGQLDDIAVFKTAVTNSIGLQLQQNSAKTVYGIDPKMSVLSPKSRFVGPFSQVGVGSITGTEYYFNSDGKTPIDFRFSGTGAGANATSISIRLDDLIDLQTQILPATSGDLNFSGKRIFKAGIRKLVLRVAVDASGPTTVVVSGEISVRGANS